MIRDCAGNESSSSDDEELGSAGPGDGERSGSCTSGDLATGEPIGSDESLLLELCSAALAGTAFPGLGDDPAASLRIDVFADVFLETFGRADRFNGVPLPPSLGKGESRLDKAEAVR